jgi:hypothetical protein
MFRQAEKTGQVQTRNMEHGLRIIVKINNGEALLAISREKVMPSLVEWRTILDALPDEIDIKPTIGTTPDGRYSLWAKWKR